MRFVRGPGDFINAAAMMEAMEVALEVLCPVPGCCGGEMPGMHCDSTSKMFMVHPERVRHCAVLMERMGVTFRDSPK